MRESCCLYSVHIAEAYFDLLCEMVEAGGRKEERELERVRERGDREGEGDSKMLRENIGRRGEGDHEVEIKRGEDR